MISKSITALSLLLLIGSLAEAQIENTKFYTGEIASTKSYTGKTDENLTCTLDLLMSPYETIVGINAFIPVDDGLSFRATFDPRGGYQLNQAKIKIKSNKIIGESILKSGLFKKPTVKVVIEKVDTNEMSLEIEEARDGNTRRVKNTCDNMSLKDVPTEIEQ